MNVLIAKTLKINANWIIEDGNCFLTSSNSWSDLFISDMFKQQQFLADTCTCASILVTSQI